jgi:hypothetical protein
MTEELPPDMLQWCLDNTWCDKCEAADLGMQSARQVEAEGRIYIEGICNRCGEPVRSEIVMKDAEPE